MNIPWKLKSSVFRFVDFFSANRSLYFIQKNVTKNSRIKQLRIRDDWIRHAESLTKYGANNLVFEFGAGKSLAQNLYLSTFVKSQIVVDLNPMIDLQLVDRARSLLSAQCNLRSKKEIHSLDDLLEYGIEYRAPYDASSTDFSNESFDACISTDTLEHIPEMSIVRIFEELSRILKRGGIVSAKIDYSDHYAHTDSSISLLNYLQFADDEWKKHNHNCHYQNRLRHFDYLGIFAQCGFSVAEEDVLDVVKDIPHSISRKFKDKPESWAAISAYVVLKKK